MQPTYVNMYELASMAASKAQELHFPPPPPEDSVNNENHNFQNEKVNNNTFFVLYLSFIKCFFYKFGKNNVRFCHSMKMLKRKVVLVKVHWNHLVDMVVSLVCQAQRQLRN